MAEEASRGSPEVAPPRVCCECDLERAPDDGPTLGTGKSLDPEWPLASSVVICCIFRTLPSAESL